MTTPQRCLSVTSMASSRSEVMAYSVYLSLDDIGTGRSKVEQVWPVGPGQVGTVKHIKKCKTR